ncbi:chemotaxis protein MotB [Lutibacter sp. Hel_I_33_5]|uniref:OmpA/MotB family protein n=1 Tax=Lutibacter sp. Hel_I_33_5 TaxID=1566289 RepID=UPI0011A92CFB|nr:OmpA family protein [Lutibacter sp. Hel_I_33_5]TVZ55324.1 chemotaxis protein MotB [Lutibacter sp. Hel_I_33_5]
MKKLTLALLAFVLIATSCVSKKKYVQLESKYHNTKGSLQKLQLKYAKIDKRIELYNDKINSLSGNNEVNLKTENAFKLEMVDGKAVLSKEAKSNLNKTLSKISPEKLTQAKTLKDSINLAMSYNIVRKTLGKTEFNSSDDIKVDIEETVVMISISDKLLFSSGSYNFKKSGLELLTKVVDIIQSEKSLDVMVEGHTDSQTIQNESVQDNWDLSVKRATTIVRILQSKFDIEGSRLIASGRGDTIPLYPNDSKTNRAKNRRTKIILMPNLNKFFALLAEEGIID